MISTIFSVILSLFSLFAIVFFVFFCFDFVESSKLRKKAFATGKCPFCGEKFLITEYTDPDGKTSIIYQCNHCYYSPGAIEKNETDQVEEEIQND